MAKFPTNPKKGQIYSFKTGKTTRYAKATGKKWPKWQFIKKPKQSRGFPMTARSADILMAKARGAIRL